MDNLVERLEAYLDDWLVSPQGLTIRDMWGIDGYVCVQNFIQYVRENATNDTAHLDNSGCRGD